MGALVMSRTRKLVVGVVAMLSLVGVGGAVQAGSPHPDGANSAHTRWCC